MERSVFNGQAKTIEVEAGQPLNYWVVLFNTLNVAADGSGVNIEVGFFIDLENAKNVAITPTAQRSLFIPLGSNIIEHLKTAYNDDEIDLRGSETLHESTAGNDFVNVIRGMMDPKPVLN